MAIGTRDLALGKIGLLPGDNPFQVNPEADYISQPQHDNPLWSETMFFLVWDPAQEVGVWIHVGVVPEDKTMWWAQTFAVLPDGIILVDRSFGRPSGRSPDTGNLQVNCIEPGRRWNLVFDGSGEVSSRKALAEGPVGAGPALPFKFDLRLEATAPIYDMHFAMGQETLDWDMGAFHHEQSFRASGTISALDKTWEISGFSVRDHSRGERHFGRFGGHVWNHCVWPKSGRSLCVFSMWRPGTHEAAASVAMLMENGHTEVFNDFTLTGMTEAGGAPEDIRLKFIRADGSRVELHGEVVANLTITYAVPNLNLNGNWSAARHHLDDPIVADESVVRWQWTDGEVGYASMERAFRNSLSPCPISPLPTTSVFYGDV